MFPIHRREILGQGAAGLAVAGAAALTLRADAAPTNATPDLHKYEDFLDAQGVPRVAPAEKWEPSYQDVLGPYHLAGAPFRGKVTAPLEPGETLVVRGRVWSYETKKPIPRALIDVWQADAKGNYDMVDPRQPPKWAAFRNRIRLLSDETGYYEFETIKPGRYRVGSGYRPAHIHYMLQAPGYRKLITQLYFKGDPHIARDRSARKSNLIIDPETVKVAGGKFLRGTFDVVLKRA